LYFSAFTTAAGRELWQVNAAGAVSPVADLDREERRNGVTGYYEIEIQRPLNKNA
jgi:ELWxxDGT repeat protein